MTAGGGPPRTAEDLVAALVLEEPEPERFRARTPGSWSGGRVFGGIVVAQALMAALRSVSPAAPGLRPHSLHGYFLEPVAPDAEVELEVEPLRDSRSFAVRQVTTVQGGRPASRVICSFHVDEPADVDYQLAPPTTLGPPDNYERWDDDAPFDLRVADRVAAGDGTFVASGRHWVRLKGRLPDDPALHCCLLAFFSDQTRLSFRPYTPEAWGTHTDASLDHAVWFHRRARADQWLRYELQALVASGNRATVRGLMYDEGGALIMSMAQELLVRPVPGAEPQVPPWGAKLAR